MEKLKQKALLTLKQNLQRTQEGNFFVAGGNQFKTMWVRDFCYSVPGLLRAGYSEIVEKQLCLIYQYQNQDGFLPRGIDVTNPKARVVWNTFFSGVPFPIKYENGNLKPEYLGEHHTPAFDSNLLFIKGCCQLAQYTKSNLILTNDEVRGLFNIYKFDSAGLISQPAYSDWQDSVRREGRLLLTQLLFLEVMVTLRNFQIKIFEDDQLQKMEKRIIEKYFMADQKLFREQEGNDRISLDSHILFLSSKEILKNISREDVFGSLLKSNLWIKNLVPGIPVSPVYSPNDISWTTKIVGLRHYHDGFHWGWLVAEAYRVCKLMGSNEEAARIGKVFSESNEGFKYLSEIYNLSDENLVPVSRPFYKSECPFTWTAAKWVEALDFRSQ